MVSVMLVSIKKQYSGKNCLLPSVIERKFYISTGGPGIEQTGHKAKITAAMIAIIEEVSSCSHTTIIFPISSIAAWGR